MSDLGTVVLVGLPDVPHDSYTASCEIELAIPWSVNLSLNGGAESADSPTMTVGVKADTLSGYSVTHYRLREGDGEWSEWFEYAPQQREWQYFQYTFSGTGQVSLSAQYIDEYGNISPVCSDSIYIIGYSTRGAFVARDEETAMLSPEEYPSAIREESCARIVERVDVVRVEENARREEGR